MLISKTDKNLGLQINTFPYYAYNTQLLSVYIYIMHHAPCTMRHAPCTMHDASKENITLSFYKDFKHYCQGSGMYENLIWLQ